MTSKQYVKLFHTSAGVLHSGTDIFDFEYEPRNLEQKLVGCESWKHVGWAEIIINERLNK